jgi:hypothetical protein
MRLIYLIGPYRSNPRLWTERMCNITRRATQSDNSHEFTIIAPHPMIMMGGYGDDDNHLERVKGITQTLNLLMIVASLPDSELWVVLDDDGQYTQGTEFEVELWRLWRDSNIHEYKYDQWLEYMETIWPEE